MAILKKKLSGFDCKFDSVLNPQLLTTSKYNDI